MTPTILAILLFVSAIVLIVGEILLPAHGLLGAIGALSFAAAMCVCFYINQWFGLVIFLCSIAASPFLIEAAVSLWQRTPIGKKLMLPPIEPQVFSTQVKIGEEGVAVSHLMPMGECDFGEQRIEVISEYGAVEPGSRVKVIGLTNGRPTVRPVAASSIH